MKFLLTLLTIVAALYLLAALLLFLLQRKFMYFSTPFIDHAYEEVVLTAAGDDSIELRVIVVNPGRQHAVLYFGGNAEAVVHSAAPLADALPEHTLYLVNYRGYGGSSGTPSEANLFSDARQIYDRIATDHQEVSAIGRSLGSGVVCWLAAEVSLTRLVLITPYDSILNIARAAYPIFPVRWLLRDRYESIRYASGISVPVLALIASNDTVIPAASSQRLVAAFANVEVQLLDNSGHNDLQTHANFYPALANFLAAAN